MLSVIIPCYNEEGSLPVVYEEVTKVLSPVTEYELLFVNDGSRDRTLELIRQFAKNDDHVRYLSFSRNFGKESAMYAGLCNAGGDYVVTMDADMQDPPSILPKMLEILKTEDYDSVATRRIDRKDEPVIRSWFAKAFYRLINKLSDADIVDGARDFRMMKRKMVDAVIAMSEYNRFSKGIYGWVGFKTYWLPFENRARVAGATKWSFGKLFRYAFDGIINFSDAPLNIASWIGLIMTLIAFIGLVFVVVRKLIFGDPVSGWASTVSIIVFIGGIQLFCLGIIGQYIAKIYMETKDRPHYIVNETNCDDAKMIR